MFDYTPPDDWGYNCECASCDSYDYGCDDFHCGCESCEDTLAEEVNLKLNTLYDTFDDVDMMFMSLNSDGVYEALEQELSNAHFNFYKFNTKKGWFEHK